MIVRYPNVIFIDERTTYIDEGVIIGKNTIIEPNVTIKGKTVIGTNNIIGSATVIENMTIGDKNKIKASYLEDSFISNENEIGPFAHILGNSIIDSFNTIGNYVELKNVKLSSHNKVKHLSYLGDTTMGDNNNVGAGTIAANYNSTTKEKNKTNIANNVSIGSNAVLVAPLTLGDKATVAAGSVITTDVGDGELAIARERQINKKNYS